MKFDTKFAQYVITKIIEDDYVFFISPDVYTSQRRFDSKHLYYFDIIKNCLWNYTSNQFMNWTLKRKALWLSKHYFTLDKTRHFKINVRKEMGSWKKTFKKLKQYKFK